MDLCAVLSFILLTVTAMTATKRPRRPILSAGIIMGLSPMPEKEGVLVAIEPVSILDVLLQERKPLS